MSAWRHPLQSLLALAGRSYVPGAALEDALRVAAAHAAQGRSSTLGCFSAGDDDAPTVAARTAAIVPALAALDPPGYVSIKAPSLHYDLDALDAVLASCRQHGMRAHFDSHDLGNAELTLACVEHAVEQGLAAGLTLPGRWRRSVDDAAHLAALGVRARVVKGEWPDPEAPDADARAGVLAVVDALIAAGATDVALASHDAPLVRQAIGRLRAAGVTGEIELLHGLPMRELLTLARELGVPVRVYVPFGVAWRPYALRKALRQPRILLWLAKDVLQGLRQRSVGA